MNLVAKEYVACRFDETGALVLSEFTGAADELSGAFLVNPHDIEGLKETIVRAARVARARPGAGCARCAGGSASTTWPTGRPASCAPWTRAGRAALLGKRKPRPRGLIMGAGAQVLVVGAGPSGLLAAVELARHGVAVRLVEREPEPHREARATAIQPGTLEILAQAGVAAPFLAAAAHVKFARVLDEELRPLSESSFASAGGHWDIQCSLPQWQTEQLLTARLAELGGTVERGVSLVSLEPHSGGVLAGLEHAGGRAELAEARWVVGAGGAHSVTRESLDEELAGQTYPGLALAADVAVSCGLPRDGSALIATARGYVLLAPLPGERWITFVGDLDQAEAARLSEGGAGPEAAAELVRAALERRAGGAVTVDDVGWAAQFRMHRRLAPHLAGPRRFLLGDAGAPVQPARRRGPQLRPARRPQPGLEARARAARPGPSRPAGQLPGRARRRGPARDRDLRPGARAGPRRGADGPHWRGGRAAVTGPR